MAVEFGPVVIAGADEKIPPRNAIRLLPMSTDPHYYPWYSQTTRDCIEAMAGAVRGKHVIDFGCGQTAILAMVAARLGAARVTAIELQESLAEVARQNVALNGMESVVEVVVGTEPVPGAYLVANLGDALLSGQVSTAAPHGVATDNDGNLIRW